jgi:hypothetical protein
LTIFGSLLAMMLPAIGCDSAKTIGRGTPSWEVCAAMSPTLGPLMISGSIAPPTAEPIAQPHCAPCGPKK